VTLPRVLIVQKNVIAGTYGLGGPRPSANRLGQVRRRGHREQEAVELNSKNPVQAERNKKRRKSGFSP
jgi:hypothetical protein